MPSSYNNPVNCVMLGEPPVNDTSADSPTTEMRSPGVSMSFIRPFSVIANPSFHRAAASFDVEDDLGMRNTPDIESG